MKMIKFLIFILLFFPSICWAQLYLAVDPDPNHVEYMVEFDGNTMGPMPAFETGVDVIKIMDIESMVITNEKHMVRVAAYNAWGDISEWSDPFEFLLTETGGVVKRQVPTAPASIRLLSE